MDIENKYGKAEDYGTKEVQKVLLDMLKNFHAFCVQNDVKYSLNSGSALGAVRHKGFIPWDDDADIMMDRTNFQKLLSLNSQGLKWELKRVLWIYRIKSTEQNKDNETATIDIFVVDNVPDWKFSKSIKMLMIKCLQGSMKTEVDYSKYSPFYKACIFITYEFGRLFSEERKINFYHKVSQIGNANNTKYVGIYNNIYKALSRLYDADMMKEYELVDFEDTKLYITKKWHEYLSAVYGDYMTPPSLDDRKTGNYEINMNGNSVILKYMKHT